MSVYLYGAVSLLLKATGLWETIGFPVDIAALQRSQLHPEQRDRRSAVALRAPPGAQQGRRRRRMAALRRADRPVALADRALFRFALAAVSHAYALYQPAPLPRGWTRWALLGGIGALAYAVQTAGSGHADCHRPWAADLRCATGPAQRSSGKLRRWTAACVALCLTAAVCFGLIGGLAPLFGFELAPEEALGRARTS